MQKLVPAAPELKLAFTPDGRKRFLTDSVNDMKEVESIEQKSHKSKGGRPPKKVKRNAQLMVRLSEIERFLIESKAKDAGLRPSTWLRQAARKARVVARLSPEEAGFIRMLAGLANNLTSCSGLRTCRGCSTRQKRPRSFYRRLIIYSKD